MRHTGAPMGYASGSSFSAREASASSEKPVPILHTDWYSSLSGS